MVSASTRLVCRAGWRRRSARCVAMSFSLDQRSKRAALTSVQGRSPVRHITRLGHCLSTRVRRVSSPLLAGYLAQAGLRRAQTYVLTLPDQSFTLPSVLIDSQPRLRSFRLSPRRAKRASQSPGAPSFCLSISERLLFVFLLHLVKVLLCPALPAHLLL